MNALWKQNKQFINLVMMAINPLILLMLLLPLIPNLIDNKVLHLGVKCLTCWFGITPWHGVVS